MLKKIFRKLGAFKIKTCEDSFNEESSTKEMYSWRLWNPVVIIYIILFFLINVLLQGVPETISDITQLKEWYDWE